MIEAGSGTGAALSDILSVVGKKGRITGIDPTKAFVEDARSRALKLGVSNARYEIGDIRSIAAGNGRARHLISIQASKPLHAGSLMSR